jgi:hypothetical protein
MKRLMQILVAGGLLLAGNLMEMLADDEPAYRYLIVLENSARMERQREVALDTVHELILGGIYGRIREGEVLGVWTFRDRARQDQFRPVVWSPGRARDVANDVYRVLRDEGFAREASLDQAMSSVLEVASAQQRLLVFLVVSGAQPVRGTSFDEEINAVYEEHAEAMRKNRKPFVTVLVLENGVATGHATTPGGRRIYIPPQARPVAEEVVPTAVVAPPAEPEPEWVEPAASEVVRPAPKPLTVAEIEERLREVNEERLRRGAEEEARRLAEQVVVPIEGETGSELTERVVPTQRPAEVTLDELVQPVVDEVDESLLSTSDEGGNGAGPLAEGDGLGLPAAPGEELAGGVQGEGDGVAVPGIMLPPGGKEKWMYLLAGVTLLALAGGLSAYLYNHSGPRRVRPSVISRSLDRFP